jgi:transposase InsO family protein
MQILKIQALAKRKFKVTADSDHSLLVYDNIIGRDFNAHAINKKWVGDIINKRRLALFSCCY